MKNGRDAVKRAANLILIAMVIALMAVGVKFLINKYNTIAYPIKYSEIVEKYCGERGLDKSFVYAVIYCESGFDAEAKSYVDARGLMQITSDTFDWLKFKMKDEREITFDDMYDPELNVEYGTFLLKFLLDEFEYPENVLCAYHAGRTTAKKWLENPEYSSGGKITAPPYKDTASYMNKVMSVADTYRRIYFE